MQAKNNEIQKLMDEMNKVFGISGRFYLIFEIDASKEWRTYKWEY